MFTQVSSRRTFWEGLLLLLLGLVMLLSVSFATTAVCNAGNLLVLRDGRIGFIVSGHDLLALSSSVAALKVRVIAGFWHCWLHQSSHLDCC